MEEALHHMPVMRMFARIDASQDAIPDEMTILNFRNLLEAKGLIEAIFAKVNALLTEQGPLLRHGTLVDVTLIAVDAHCALESADRGRGASMMRRTARKGVAQAASGKRFRIRLSIFASTSAATRWVCALMPQRKQSCSNYFYTLISAGARPALFRAQAISSPIAKWRAKTCVLNKGHC